MPTDKPIAPRWIVARLGDDLNWWVEETSRALDDGRLESGVLDPRQVAHLAATLAEYHPYGLRPDQIAPAFQAYELESEISDGRVRLVAHDAEWFRPGEPLFALPLSAEDATGAYQDFLDALSAARIRLLNATHHYHQDCTELDMTEELQALDADRYFSADAMHAFDEINEILQWKPAEWDDTDTL